MMWCLGLASIKPSETLGSGAKNEGMGTWRFSMILYFRVCLNICKIKHFLKCPIRRFKPRCCLYCPTRAPHSPQWHPGWLSSCFPNNLWGYSSLCAHRVPRCLLPHSWHLDKYLFLTPDGITASSVWSGQHIFSRHLIPGCGNKKNPTEMSWLLPLNNLHPREQVFPILTMSALWAPCFHWLPNNSPVRISQTAVPAGQSIPGEWKAARVGGIIILLIINGKAGTNKQLYRF